MSVELLWFEGCPNHAAAEAMLSEVLAAAGVTAPIERIEVIDEQTGRSLCFPGSPTIRIDGRDVDPSNDPCTCEDCAPRCRLYATADGLRGLPERRWVEAAVRSARA